VFVSAKENSLANDFHLAYGPAESATFFLYEFKGPCGKIVPIGPAPNTYSWVVNPNNPELLSPLGAIGEMLYEGPGLLQEYLGGPKKTSQVLIDPPSWRQSLGVPAPSCKLYRSGDLVRYLPDGTLMYIGRKDTMVKVRGQKLEVEEVESVIRKSLGGSGQVAVDLVELHDSGPRLVAFLQSSETQDKDAHTKTGSTGKLRSNFIPDDKMTALISRIRSHLVETLPAFMIPRIFIPLAALPTNSNGKLDRARLKQHARSLPTSELFKYTDSGSSDGVLTDIPKDDTVALKISEILLNVLGDTVSNEESSLKGKNATLENLGLDSLRTVSFARAINSSFGLDIPIKTFRRVNLKVRDLAEIVRSRNQVAGQSEEHTHAADILQDIEKLSEELAEMQPYQGEYSKKGLPTSSRVVFLTGATGFLGSQILRQLLALDHVSKVIVLVRARDASAGFERIVAAATTSRWWSPALANRIEVWPGDLAQPRLGVSMDRWAYLESKAVTDIIHNGAVVNWSWSYERLRATNVLSTLQILKLALAGQIQHYTYISGGDMHLTEKAVAEDLSHLSSADGYSQSKFASDVLVDRCASRAPSGTRINMVKPGIIIGTATEGISNTDDFIWRLAAGVCEAGAYVDGEQDAMVCLAGADQVAQRIIQSCLGGPDCDGTPRALRMTQGIPVRDFWNMVSKGTGITLRAMEFVDWFQVVNANVARQGSSHLLWPVMEWVEQRKGRIGDPHLIRCQSSNCSGHCLGVGEETLAVQCQPDDETKNKTLQALSKSIDYLSALRFLQGGIALKDGNQDVFSRSKAVN
jgi:thioester reductase-like protein